MYETQLDTDYNPFGSIFYITGNLKNILVDSTEPRDGHAQRESPNYTEKESNLLSNQVCCHILRTGTNGLCA